MPQPGRSLAPEAAVASAEPQPGVLASPRPTAEERLRVLITGASGMLGSELTPVIAGAGYEVYPRPRAELDVTDVEEVARAFRQIRPEIVINCAAFTRVDDDQKGRPTETTDLSEAILALLTLGVTGVVHFANRGEVTWFEFARQILTLAGHGDVRVVPTTAAAIARPASRPSNSVLDTSKYEALTNRPIRHFREPLLEYMARRALPEA